MIRSVTILSVTALLLAQSSAFAEAITSRPSRQQFPISVALGDIKVHGELGQRLEASFNRLEDEIYRSPKLYDESNEGWPGDKEGRTLLALVMLSQVTGREAKYLKDILDAYPQRVNANGYLGPPLAPDAISEQTLGGQFWLVRSFYEYAAWKHDERALTWADQILKNVYFPAAGAFQHYPVDKTARKSQDFVFGKETGRSGKWILSSDVSCGLAGSLDALTDTCARKPSKELESLLNEVIERFLQMDLAAVGAQTHSTLTAIRSLLRHYETTGRKELLWAAIERYHLYRNKAMTDNFENHNWFGRPEWTESCAVVDSFIAAVQLWRLTGEPQYLEDAHHIYYNGICADQRSNGGFGCNSCPSRSNPFLSIKTQEAHWCCTQRGADGLTQAARYCFFTDETGVFVPFYHDSDAVMRWKDQTMTLRVKTEYPWKGRVRIEVISVWEKTPKSIRFFIPSWAEKPMIMVNGQPVDATLHHGFLDMKWPWQSGDTLDLLFTQNVSAKPPVNRTNGAEQGDYRTFHYGPLILGYDGTEVVKLGQTASFKRLSDREFAVEETKIKLQPIYNLLDPLVSQAKGYRRQTLFAD